MHARLGMPVDSTDGPWGELDDLVVDPTTWHVTHLVIQPHGHHEQSHLVPVDVVEACDERLHLTLSPSEIDETPHVEITAFVKVERPEKFGNDWTSEASEVTAWPYYPYAGSSINRAGNRFLAGYGNDQHERPHFAATKFDHMPDDEVEIRRSSHVISSDEHRAGTVDGFVFDDAGAITHLVLDHGHLWAHREITIPIQHVVRANRERVRLNVSRSEIGAFPAVRFHRHPRR